MAEDPKRFWFSDWQSWVAFAIGCAIGYFLFGRGQGDADGD